MAARARSAGARSRTDRKPRGPAPADLAPLSIRSGLPLPDGAREAIRARLASRLATHASRIERVTARVDAADPSEDGANRVCKVKVAFPDLPSLVVEERGTDLAELAGRAADAVERAVQRALQRERAAASRRPAASEPRTAGARGGEAIPDDEGSLIGRRVGHAQANLERALARPEKKRRDVYVDTAAPGTSATDRKAGHGASARRNTRRNLSGMTAALEDSRTEPSRKSSRRSANRMRSGTKLERKATARSVSPKARATRAQVERDKPRRPAR